MHVWQDADVQLLLGCRHTHWCSTFASQECAGSTVVKQWATVKGWKVYPSRGLAGLPDRPGWVIARVICVLSWRHETLILPFTQPKHAFLQHHGFGVIHASELQVESMSACASETVHQGDD